MKAEPLAQEYVVVARTPSKELITDDPALVRLPSGRLLATWTYRGTRDFEAAQCNPQRFRLALSDDEGRTWNELKPLEINMGMPFVHEGVLYLLGNALGRKDIIIIRSEDEGRTWTPFVTLFRGSFWNAPTGYAVKGDTFYRAFGAPNADGVYNTKGSRCVVVAGDLGKDLLRASAWRLSNQLAYPGTPQALRIGLFDREDHWLEPNVVSVKGRVRMLVRLRLDHYATSNLAAVCDVEDDGETLDLRFSQFYPVPGAQNKFHIVYDKISRLFWMTSNLPTSTQDMVLAEKLSAMEYKGSPGNERRFLMLFYSIDALNWFQACCLACWPSMFQSFNYVTQIIDGDDMLFLSRTSRNGRDQHDADLVTFHRLADFRSLALPVHPSL